MVGFVDALKNAARSAACSVGEASASLFPKPPGLDLLGFGKAAFAFRDNFIRNFCNDEPPPPPSPFTGGQCPVKYRVRVEWTGTNRVTETPVDGFVEGDYWGPILGVRTQKPSDTYFPDGGDCYLKCYGRATDTTPLPVPLEFKISELFYDDLNFYIASVTRLDGQPDNCGDPPPVIAPYNPGDFTIDTDINYTNNDGIDITIPVVGVVGVAFVDADLNLNVPVSFTFSPNFNFDPTFTYNIDVNLNLGGGDDKISPPYVPPDKPYRPGPPGSDSPSDYLPGDDVPTPPTDTPDPPAPDPDEPKARVIRGVLVTVTEISPDAKPTQIGQGDNPDIFAPALGYVSFQIRLGNGSGGWTSDIPVKNIRNLIPCPWGGGALSVKGTPTLGVVWTLTPIYALPDEEFR